VIQGRTLNLLTKSTMEGVADQTLPYIQGQNFHVQGDLNWRSFQ